MSSKPKYASASRNTAEPLASTGVATAICKTMPTSVPSWIRHVAFALLSVWLLYHGVWGTIGDHQVGDSHEYILMNNALIHHGTPDLRPGDTWNRDVDERLKIPPKGPRDFLLGFLPARNGRWYCWHFFFYPTLNLPMRVVAESTGLPDLQTFTMTNALLIICVAGQMLYATRYPLELQLVGVAFFIWSSVLWYFSWPHPEVMTCAFVFMSLISWFHGQHYPAILLSSLAAMQNPPLFVLSLFYLVPTLFRRVPNVLFNMLMCGVTSFWVIVPALFYRYHYGVGSLIIDLGYVDRKMITFTRLWGFFFDLNQGMIISLPTVLPLLMLMYLIALIRTRRPSYNSLLVPLLIGMTFFIMPTTNWNHGQAGINRYAAWCSMIPLAYLINMLNDGWNHARFVLVMLFVLAPQVFVVQYYGGLHVPRDAFLKHKEPAIFLLEHFPWMYNPDPQIFVTRTAESTMNTSEVVPFIGHDGKIKKIAVRRGAERKLLDYGLTEGEIQQVVSSNSYLNEWLYVNENDFRNRVK